MRLFDTARQDVVPFEPGPTVTMYTCGITPYAASHIGHASTYRIYLRKAGNDRIAKIIDSPYHPYSDVRFTVNEKGIDDSDPDAPKKKSAAKGKDSDD